jgi:hypothetical protein
MTLHELLFDQKFFETKIRVAAEYAELNSLDTRSQKRAKQTEHKIAAASAVAPGAVRNIRRLIAIVLRDEFSSR